MASVLSCKDPKEIYALKQKAIKYYEENGVPVKMEEILNSMFHDNPPDVYGHLVNFFTQFAKPAVLSKVHAQQVFDSTGLPTIQADVFCTVNNLEKETNSSTIPSANFKGRAEDREKAELDIQESVQTAISMINTDLNKKLSGMDPLSQREIDALLVAAIEAKKEEMAMSVKETENTEEAPTPSNPPPADEKDKRRSSKGKGGKGSAPLVITPSRTLEVFAPGSEVVAAVSQAVCACAATTRHIPIYRHVGNLARSKGALHEFRIPLPMVTIIQAGRSSSGKVKCVRDYMVVPGVNMPVEKSIEHILQIYNRVAKTFAAKSGASAKLVNEFGALCPPLDTPTQALDILQEAVNAEGLTIGEDIYLAIDAAGHECFDFEKGKYEVTNGQLKSPDDMVEFWADIVTKYPSIVALIDPIRGEDTDQWMRLCERVSEALFVVGDNYYVRPGLLKLEGPPSPVRTSGIVMNMERMNTVSDIIDCANQFQNLSNEVVIAANQGDVTDTFIVDLAVGVNARFLKVGGPCRGERACKLNRLLQIANELEPPGENEHQAEDEEEEPTISKEDLVDKEELLTTHESEENNELDSQGAHISSSTHDEGVKESVESTWGHNEKNRRKNHSPFVFPLVENPPPVVLETGEDEGQTESHEKA